MKTTHLLLACLLCLLFSCKSSEELLAEGKYNQVIGKLRLKAKKGKLNPQESAHLLKAINHWSDKKSFELSQLLAMQGTKSWRKGLKSLSSINKSQSNFVSYPQLDKDELVLVNTKNWKNKYDEQLLTHYHKEFDFKVKEYKDLSDRSKIFSAYKIVDEMEEYTRDLTFIDSLREHCLDLGHRVFKVTGSFLSARDFRSSIWNQFENDIPDSQADYEVNTHLDYLREGDDTDNQYIDFSKEVVDYYETETDTLGNKTETPIYKTITANVKETTFIYKVNGQANISIYDINDNAKVVHDYYEHTAVDEVVLNFLNYGEKEAVPDDVELETFSIQFFDYSDLRNDVVAYLAGQVKSSLGSSKIE